QYKQMRAFLFHVYRQITLPLETTAHGNQEECNTAPKAKPTINPLFPFPDRLSSVFSALGEKANS
ncbi:MAG: hypothetical protein ACK49X_06955, partial [Akkermansiaceae bacterium]